MQDALWVRARLLRAGRNLLFFFLFISCSLSSTGLPTYCTARRIDQRRPPSLVALLVTTSYLSPHQSDHPGLARLSVLLIRARARSGRRSAKQPSNHDHGPNITVVLIMLPAPIGRLLHDHYFWLPENVAVADDEMPW